MKPEIAIQPEESQLLSAASEYQDLVKQAGWKRLLKAVRAWEQAALNDLGSKLSSDPRLVQQWVLRWRERKALVQQLEQEVLGTIQSRNEWVREYLKERRLDPAPFEPALGGMEEFDAGSENAGTFAGTTEDR